MHVIPDTDPYSNVQRAWQDIEIVFLIVAEVVTYSLNM